VLIHGAAGGVGSALVQLGRLAGLEMCGTCSSRGASAVIDLGAVPIDYQYQDFVAEMHRRTSAGVDVVFDASTILGVARNDAGLPVAKSGSAVI
jgi:NADPH2:quinone reductase